MITGGYAISPWFTGDVDFADAFSAEENDSSPGQIQVVNLDIGVNTITVPTGAIAVTIIPPIDNVGILTLRGIGGDVGIPIHATNPCLLSLSTDTFVINSTTGIAIRLIFV